MITNVTQKDRTLHEIIDWCEQYIDISLFERSFLTPDEASFVFLTGECHAMRAVASHCEERLGYSGGSMPLEVPNQSEGAE